MESTVGSGLWLWLLGFSTLMVDPTVLQVFYGYVTIQACWDRRRTDRRVSTLGWSPRWLLLFGECFVVVAMETIVAVVVVSIGACIVAILL